MNQPLAHNPKTCTVCAANPALAEREAERRRRQNARWNRWVRRETRWATTRERFRAVAILD